jgi:hypothetical protein
VYHLSGPTPPVCDERSEVRSIGWLCQYLEDVAGQVLVDLSMPRNRLPLARFRIHE